LGPGSDLLLLPLDVAQHSIGGTMQENSRFGIDSKGRF
jgi:hypothetical protein